MIKIVVTILHTPKIVVAILHTLKIVIVILHTPKIVIVILHTPKIVVAILHTPNFLCVCVGGVMQYRNDNFGGMQYHNNNFNQIPILSTKRTTLQMAVDGKFANIGINIQFDLKSARNSLSNDIKYVQIGQVLTKLWTPQFQTLVV